jgi:hypothetical protein
MFPNQESRKALAVKLGLPFTEDMQDWEYEVSDKARIEEFLSEYSKPSTTDQERISLIEILLSCINDFLEEGNQKAFSKYFPKVIKHLNDNKSLFSETIRYWTTHDFKVAPYLTGDKNCL